jgi:hypothetical protein
MVIINFNYSGEINGVPINGNAVLNAEPETGNLMASAQFSSFPMSFTPEEICYSKISISCINGGKGQDGSKNIMEVANNVYNSIRDIDFFNASTGEFLGHITINGIFTRVSENVFSANVVLMGNYSGPINITKPDGYILPLTKTEEYKLEGSFEKILQTADGEAIKTINYHRYYFNDGVSSPLENIKGILTFDTDETNWNPDEKTLQLKGTSIIQPL